MIRSNSTLGASGNCILTGDELDRVLEMLLRTVEVEALFRNQRVAKKGLRNSIQTALKRQPRAFLSSSQSLHSHELEALMKWTYPSYFVHIPSAALKSRPFSRFSPSGVCTER